MKAFEDLTKDEKQKMQIYLMLRGLSNMKFLVIMLIAMMMYIPGVIFLFADVRSLFFLGILFIGMSLVIVLFIFQKNEMNSKYLRISMGMTDIMEDMFDISKEDIKKVKKVWRVVK